MNSDEHLSFLQKEFGCAWSEEMSSALVVVPPPKPELVELLKEFRALGYKPSAYSANKPVMEGLVLIEAFFRTAHRLQSTSLLQAGYDRILSDAYNYVIDNMVGFPTPASNWDTSHHWQLFVRLKDLMYPYLGKIISALTDPSPLVSVLLE